MAPALVHLPNGQNLTIAPVFGGVGFKSNELSVHRSAFPPGWTVILNQEDGDDEGVIDHTEDMRPHAIHRYKRPSLHNDHLFISSISNPSSADFKPPISPTRQIAMMLWSTLWWYFHQPEPERTITTQASSKTAEAGKPKGEWRIYINREGIFKGKNLIQKLERMGLITTEDSSVGCLPDDRGGNGWNKMFVSRRSFWQLDPRAYLFTLSPVTNSPFPPSSPSGSRPHSRERGSRAGSPARELHVDHTIPRGAITPIAFDPYQSSSHLPTFYPPHPAQYTITNGIRHPIRGKPWRQGETVYVRYVPSVGQYLSFRVASISTRACTHAGPWNMSQPSSLAAELRRAPQTSALDSIAPAMSSLTTSSLEIRHSDVELLHRWMNDKRVSEVWGEEGPQSRQQEFLEKALSHKHSFPVIGCWDGKPFGYFEIYWVKEDILGKYLGGEVNDYDRGFHCLVGEQEFRGPDRVKLWLSALVHFCWMADLRTNTVMLEPRVDNTK